MAAQKFHLGWFLQGSSVQAWNEPWTGNIDHEWQDVELFCDIARALERACFDYVLIEDSSYVGESYGESMDIYLAKALSTPRQDPIVTGALMTQATSRIGIVPTIGTYQMHPYQLARTIGTLDQVSRGRIGWNMVTGSSDPAARNFGLDAMPPHDERYEMADEFMEAVNGLWDSWAPDAIVADRENGVLADGSKVRHVDFEGKYYKTHGPLNSGPLPQGRPVIDRLEERLAVFGKVTNINFAALDWDAPVGELTTNGHQQDLAQFLASAGPTTTLREAAEAYFTRQSAAIDLVGSPSEVAEMMSDIMEQVGGDGFLITLPDTSRKSVAEIADGLVPELQKRGLTRTSYTYEKFRDNMLEF